MKIKSLKIKKFFLPLIILQSLFFLITSSTSDHPSSVIFNHKSYSCPNTPLSNLGLVTSFLSSQSDSIYETTLTPSERKSYEDMITLKRSFSSSLTFLSMSFSPEKPSYWDGLDYLVFVFFVISLFPILFILFYLVMRFIFKKCTGPRKTSDINRFYRNSSWVIMVLCQVIIVILFSIILGYSVKTHNAVKNTFNSGDIMEESNQLYEKIDEVVKYFREKNLEAPSEPFMNDFKKNINSYINKTIENTNQINDDDYNRHVGMVLLYIYYLISIILTYVFFFKRWKIAEMILAILMLLTIPSMMIFEGYNAKFFFYYGDLCDAVNGALYSEEFPVAGQSLGYYYNCFSKDTKSQLFSIRFTLYNSAHKEQQEMIEVMEKYEKLNDNVLTPQLKCNLVTETLPKIESQFCLHSLKYLYSMLGLMTWLLLLTVIFALNLRRFEILIWKKKNEIESMIDNIESIY